MPVISPGEFETPTPNICAGCGGKISDRYYLLAVDRQWHLSCLTCCQCKVQLDSELTCFSRDGHIYCKEDYYRLFAVKRCARCQRGIFASELVMRAKDLVFHLHCFTCAWCNTVLSQGDYFGLRDNLVYCRGHYELLVRGETLFTPPQEDLEDNHHHHHHHHPDMMSYPMGGPGCLTPGAAPGDQHGGCIATSLMGDRTPLGEGPNYAASFPSMGTGKKGRPRKRKNADLSVDGVHTQNIGLSSMEGAACNLHLSHLDGSASSLASPPLTPLPNGQTQRTKRMRTSFKHHQLRTMKSYFSINQNPDAKDLKQLAQKTGLSKRVLQVWFQNARAKWRRNNMKQQEPSHMGNGDHLLSAQQSQSIQHGLQGGVGSPGATSSISEPSPVPSCGVPSDGSMSTQTSTQVSSAALDFDNSNPLTPLMSHHTMQGVQHNGEGLHITSFHELF